MTGAPASNAHEGDVAVPTSTIGIILAAGAGTRMGTPKALMSSADGTPWLHRASMLLAEAGCEPILVVLGAREDEARALLASCGTEVRAVVAPDWAEGMAHSLRAGLAAASAAEDGPSPVAALITVVDMPDLPLSVVRRITRSPLSASTLRQAVYNGVPGHPVVLGRSHWGAVAADITGDRGARQYLVAHGVEEVECADLFDGHDIDTARAAAAVGAVAAAPSPSAAPSVGASAVTKSPAAPLG